MSSPLKNNTDKIQNILDTINSISTKPAETYTPTDSDQIISGGVYLTGDQTITGDENLKSENIKSGVSIFGVDGSFEGGGDLAKSIIERTVTEISDDTATRVGEYAFHSCSALTSVNFHAVTSISRSAFQSCSGLIAANFPIAKSIGSYAFYTCTALTTADFPAATSIDTYVFHGCKNLTTADFPAATSIGTSAFNECYTLININFPAATIIGSTAFQRCWKLTTADFPMATSIGSAAFNGIGAFTTLILRNTDKVATLSNVNALASTMIASGDGYIYVPAALIEDYKVATNWSTYAAQFRALEDYTVDGTTTGELDPSKI